jgi:hypothetical protein
MSGTTDSDFDIYVSHSIDAGKSWTDPAPLNSTAAFDLADDTSVTIASDGRGRCVAAWSSTTGEISDIGYSVSSDSGVGWSDAKTLNASTTLELRQNLSPRIRTDGAGTWLAAWRSNDDLGGAIGNDFDILFRRSTDNGESWSGQAPLNSNASEDTGLDGSPRIECNSAGAWLAVWSSEDTLGNSIGPDRDILFARSLDYGITWSIPMPLNSDAAIDARGDFDPEIVSDWRGNWIAVWHSTKGVGDELNDDSDIYASISANDGASWSSMRAINTNAATDSGNDFAPVIATDRAGSWLALWESSEPAASKNASGWDILSSERVFTGSLAGTVRAASGEPLNKAAVLLSSDLGTVRRSVSTDANGRFRIDGLPGGKYTLSAFASDCNSASKQIPLIPDTLNSTDFILIPASSRGGVRGVITGQTSDAPLIGARVEASLGGTVLGVTYSYADGRYELLGLTHATAGVALRFSAVGHQALVKNTTVNTSTVSTVDVELTARPSEMTTVSGVVKSAANSISIPYARVTLEGRARVSTAADDQGAFSLDGLPAGAYWVRASAPGFQGQTLSIIAPAQESEMLEFALNMMAAVEGDLDGNQFVNAIDLQLVINSALDIEPSIDGDVDGDGNINALDVQFVINAALGLKHFENITDDSDLADAETLFEPGEKVTIQDSTVYWISGEDGDGDWSNPTNWNTGALPGANDIVVISRPGIELSVVFPSGTTTIKQLICYENLAIQGGFFELTGDAFVTGEFSLSGDAIFSVSGNEATFAASGPASIENAALAAANGATMDFPTVIELTNVRISVTGGAAVHFPAVESYAWSASDEGSITVDGIGSVLDLAQVRQFDIAGGGAAFNALNGGFLDLASLRNTSVESALMFTARAGGTITIDALESGARTGFSADSGSTLNLLALVDADGATFTASGDAALELPAFSALKNVSFNLAGGAIVELPSLISYTWSAQGSGAIHVDGKGTRLGFPNLTEFKVAGGPVSIAATNGGNIGLRSLRNTAVVSRLKFDVSMGGSIDLPLLTSSANTDYFAGSESRLDLSKIERVDGGEIALSGSGQIVLPAFKTLNNVVLTLADGAVLKLPSVNNIRWAQGDATIISASGKGTKLDLPNLATLSIFSGRASINASNGGVINLPMLRSPAAQTGVTFSASGGGAIHLDSLTKSSNIDYVVGDASTLRLPSISLLNTGKFSVSGTGEIVLPEFAALYNIQFDVSDGATVDLPSVTSYTWDLDSETLFSVSGPGSKLNLPNVSLLMIANGSNAISATNGGQIDFSGLQSSLVVFGMKMSMSGGGDIDLSALNLGTNTEYYVGTDSSLELLEIDSIIGTKFTVNGSGKLDLPAFTSLKNTWFVVSDGATLSLPSVTSYTWAFGNTPIFVAHGESSRLDFPNLSSIAILAGSNLFTAANGAQINLPAVQSIVTTATSGVTAIATGATSHIDLSALIEYDSSRVKFREQDGGAILSPG